MPDADINDLEEKDAWLEYHDAIKDLNERRYIEIEEWAWARLQTRLRIIQRARSRTGANP